MKSREEIEEAISDIENTWKDTKEIPDFVRGQYIMLKWVLGEDNETRN